MESGFGSGSFHSFYLRTSSKTRFGVRARRSSDVKKNFARILSEDHVRCVVSLAVFNGHAVLCIRDKQRFLGFWTLKSETWWSLPLYLFGFSSYFQISDWLLVLYKQPTGRAFEVHYFPSYSYLFMTIISLDTTTRATQRRASSATGIVKLKVNSTRTVLPATPIGIVPSQPESTTLVRDFILSFKELENYKSVHTWYNLQLDVCLLWNSGMENQSS